MGRVLIRKETLACVGPAPLIKRIKLDFDALGRYGESLGGELSTKMVHPLNDQTALEESGAERLGRFPGSYCLVSPKPQSIIDNRSVQDAWAGPVSAVFKS